MNYNIEDNLDLYTEINNCILENSKDSNSHNTNICLLTNMPLEDNYITLQCKHTFNYLAIYQETCNQKKINNLDIAPCRINEIKCPYCRKTNNGILPYFSNYNVDIIRGVTYPSKYSMKIHSCEYAYKSNKSKQKICNCSAFISEKGTLCNKHYKIVNDKNMKLTKTNESNENIQDIKYKKMTIPQLKDILRANTCKLGGKKTELITRICSEKTLRGDTWIE